MKSPYGVVREKVARLFYSKEKLSHWDKWEDISVELQVICLKAADDFLSLEIPHEGKTICFGAYEDAELPECPYGTSPDKSLEDNDIESSRELGYLVGQDDMVRTGWRKTIQRDFSRLRPDIDSTKGDRCTERSR